MKEEVSCLASATTQPQVDVQSTVTVPLVALRPQEALEFIWSGQDGLFELARVPSIRGWAAKSFKGMYYAELLCSRVFDDFQRICDTPAYMQATRTLVAA